MDPPQPNQEPSDIFSLSDQDLSDRLQFVEEIGFGNWGSVWLCRPKSDPGSPSADRVTRLQDNKIAVKLVHRSKTPTTAARVKSLWNEMKIVRRFKTDPHPSIIPFYSFIITPTYALITMAYYPTAVPVEVAETKARHWFRSLLSGVEFLHERGVVHNDIKPANILLSPKLVPVLIDFGFSELYDLNSHKAFHSNLSYGTPEYLSPERARGLPHDTRKSDVWSLGITFFEILVGRTPFENADGEQFATKDDLERYWSRTLRGKWVGTWRMSKGIERLLKRMISPNADLRCNASQAMLDPYWKQDIKVEPNNKHSTSFNSSLVFERGLEQLLDQSLSRSMKENEVLPPGLSGPKPRQTIARAKSQPKVNTAKFHMPNRKRVPADLSPIKASPAGTPSMSAKENINASTNGRRPFAPLGMPSANGANRKPFKENVGSTASPTDDAKQRRRARALADLTGASRNVANTAKGTHEHAKSKERDRAIDRVREWERERERLREMDRLEELEQERDAKLTRRITREGKSDGESEGMRADWVEVEVKPEIQSSAPTSATLTVVEKEATQARKEERKSYALRSSATATMPATNIISRSTPPRPTTADTSFNFKHKLKFSVDKGLRVYKSSATAHGMLSPALTNDGTDDGSDSMRNSRSSLPIVRQARRNEQMKADSQADRLTIWMRNVEKVVEDTRQTFAASGNADLPLPPLPLAPAGRRTSQVYSNRSSRLPRRVPASQIFAEEAAQPNTSVLADRSNIDLSVSLAATAGSSFASHDKAGKSSLDAGLGSCAASGRAMEASFSESPRTPSRKGWETLVTPSRQKRFSLLSLTPERKNKSESPSPSRKINLSPSKWGIINGAASPLRQKSQSVSNPFQRHISSADALELELQKAEQRPKSASKRLSALIDRNIFVVSPVPPGRDSESTSPSTSLDREPPRISITTDANTSMSMDELNASPYHVEPYPPRKGAWGDAALAAAAPDAQAQRRLEGVYDRFLATSGVRRVGRGYQSDCAGQGAPGRPSGDGKKSFYSMRRVMPPPVSSEDLIRQEQLELARSGDELGMLSSPAPVSPGAGREEDENTMTFVRRAFKAIVPKKTTARRL